LVRSHRRHVDDATAPAFDHRRERGVGETHDGHDVDADLSFLTVGVELPEGSGGAKPRVVHEQIDGACRVREPVGDIVDAPVGPEIGDEDLGRSAVIVCKLRRDLMEAILTAGAERHVVAAGGERLGRRLVRCPTTRR
jgi:hypothetical protein